MSIVFAWEFFLTLFERCPCYTDAVSYRAKLKALLFFFPVRFSAAMATADSVYNTTTTAEAPAAGSRRWFIVPNPNLDFIRFFVKIAEVVS